MTRAKVVGLSFFVVLLMGVFSVPSASAKTLELRTAAGALTSGQQINLLGDVHLDNSIPGECAAELSGTLTNNNAAKDKGSLETTFFYHPCHGGWPWNPFEAEGTALPWSIELLATGKAKIIGNKKVTIRVKSEFSSEFCLFEAGTWSGSINTGGPMTVTLSSTITKLGPGSSASCSPDFISGNLSVTSHGESVEGVVH